MKYIFNPTNSPNWGRANPRDCIVYADGGLLPLGEPVEISDEAAAAVESLYPKSLTLSGEEEPPKSETKTTSKKATSERNQTLDKLRAGGLKQNELLAILDAYPGDDEISKLVEKAMESL